jgi:flavin-dependent dehydrogenase
MFGRPHDWFWERIQRNPSLARRLWHSQILRRPYIRACGGYRVCQVTFDGLVLVGDAAGYLHPLMGDGILRALCSAKQAAAAVARALRQGNCSRAGLARYERWHMLRNRFDALGTRLVRQLATHPDLLTRFGKLGMVRYALFTALLRH